MSRQTARKTITRPGTQTKAVSMCRECGIIFQRKKDWKEHMTSFHDASDMLGRKYVCHECGKYLPTLLQVKEHETAHALAELVSKIDEKESDGSLKVKIKKPTKPKRNPNPQVPSKPPPPIQPLPLSTFLRPGSDTSEVQFGNFPSTSSGQLHQTGKIQFNQQLEKPVLTGFPQTGSSDPFSKEPVPVRVKPPLSTCPVCRGEFYGVSLMLAHTMTSHGAEIERIVAKVFKGDMLISQKNYMEKLVCKFCPRIEGAKMDKFANQSLCLLHMFSEHRRSMYLGFESKADKIVMTVDVRLPGRLEKPDGMIFKVNVTVNLKKTTAQTTA